MAKNKNLGAEKNTYSLLEFLRAFIAFSVTHGVKSFPPPHSQLWQKWLYLLSAKTNMVRGLEPDKFDCNGPYPKLSQWDEVVAGLVFLFRQRVSDGRMVFFDNDARRSKKFVNSLDISIYGLASFGYAHAEHISGFFEKENIATAQPKKRFMAGISVAVFIANEEGKLLMVRRALADDGGGMWGFPAGSMDAHEDPMTAAVREAKEETGFLVELIDVLRIITIDRGDDASGLAFTFRARIVGGAMSLSKDEISDCRYFAPDKITAMLRRGEIYKPEYNIANLKNWLDGSSYPLDLIQPLNN